MDSLQYKNIDELFLFWLQKPENKEIKDAINYYKYNSIEWWESVKIAQTSISFKVFAIEYNIHFVLSNIIPEIIKLFKNSEK